VAGPSEPIHPGAGANATIRLPPDNGVSHSELVTGAEFDVIEGSRLIGHGRVTSR